MSVLVPCPAELDVTSYDCTLFVSGNAVRSGAAKPARIGLTPNRAMTWNRSFTDAKWGCQAAGPAMRLWLAGSCEMLLTVEIGSLLPAVDLCQNGTSAVPLISFPMCRVGRFRHPPKRLWKRMHVISIVYKRGCAFDSATRIAACCLLCHRKILCESKVTTRADPVSRENPVLLGRQLKLRLARRRR